MTNESVRLRLKKYYKCEPVAYSKIGRMIGLNKNQSAYIIRQFVAGKNLYHETLLKLSDFLKERGY